MPELLQTQERAETELAVPPPGISKPVFLAIIWVGAGLSLLSVLFRLYSRFRGPRRLFWDDAFVVLAECLVLTTAALWQWYAQFMYYVLDAESGQIVPGPQLFPDLRRFLNMQLIAELFFYTTLILVKLSFLFFFRRLGHNVHRQKYLWWPVLIFALINYVVSLADVQYKCYTSSLEFTIAWCSSAEANVFTMATLKANMALDVISDFLIMVIPITLLWNVRMHLKKKLTFMGLFSLSIITIVIAIVRAIHVSSSRSLSGMDDPTFLWEWTGIQAPLAVIISCLSAFPQLFTASSSKSKPVWTPTDTYYQRLKSRVRTKNKKESSLYDLTAITLPGDQSMDSEFNSHVSVANPPGRNNDSASYERPPPVLVPRAALHAPSASCYAGPPDRSMAPRGNEITQQLEYRVTQQQMTQYQ